MKIAFLFSGQGAQFPGMMKDIVDTNSYAKSVFDIADRALRRNISNICFDGTEEELSITHNTQPCVLAADLAAYYAVKSFDITPDAVAGFSVGEYAAIVATGVIDINDVFQLIQNRADYMQDAVPTGEGGMLAINKLTASDVESLCNEIDDYIVPANYNTPKQIVVSGKSSAIEKMCILAEKRNIQTIKLSVSAPFHCELMSPAAEKLKVVINEMKMNNPQCPIYMNVDGIVESEIEKIKEKLVLQTKSPVRWNDTIINMANDGIDTFIELGPGKTLTKFVKRILGNEAKAYNVTDLETLSITIDTIKSNM